MRHEAGIKTVRGAIGLPTRAREGTLALSLIVFMLLVIASCEKKGSIEVNSVPLGAGVWLDDTNTRQVTNCVLTGILPGTHLVKLTRNGFWDYECRVSVLAGQNAVVNVTMDSGSAKSYYPLAQGDSWTFVVNTVTTAHQGHDTTYNYTDTLWKTALGETAYEGTVWRVQNRYEGHTSMQYISDSDSEVALYPIPGLIGCPPRFLLHMPLAENATWVAEWGENGEQPPRQLATVRSHGILTVPAGMLDDVWQVDYVDTCASETTRAWYARGIGEAMTWSRSVNVSGSDTTFETVTQSLAGYSVR